jgi:peptidoglycan hydrolase CwlO-like protein
MKASLEPKEQQIENLKEQLLELEQVFSKQSKATEALVADVKRREQKIKELQEALFKQKALTKEKERTVQSFVNDVHKIV